MPTPEIITTEQLEAQFNALQESMTETEALAELSKMCALSGERGLEAFTNWVNWKFGQQRLGEDVV